MRLFFKALSQLKENAFCDSGKKTLKRQVWTSRVCQAWNCFYTKLLSNCLQYTHIYRRSINMNKKSKVFFFHEFRLYRQLPSSQIDKDIIEGCLVLSADPQESSHCLGKSSFSHFLLFQESALPGNSPNACRHTHWLSHCHS